QRAISAGVTNTAGFVTFVTRSAGDELAETSVRRCGDSVPVWGRNDLGQNVDWMDKAWAVLA
ncbi:hypothetical protein AAB988_39020, partial [Burkholderia contaminans]|uniref:hypothetical protein n=1 Tax=Burkholderia contaminans TaxID=488447 RepID=UPI003112CB92